MNDRSSFCHHARPEDVSNSVAAGSVTPPVLGDGLGETLALGLTERLTLGLTEGLTDDDGETLDEGLGVGLALALGEMSA